MVSSLKNMSMPMATPHSNSPRGHGGTHALSSSCTAELPDCETGRVRGRTGAREALQRALEEQVESSSVPASPRSDTDRGELGYRTNLDEIYEVRREIGRGANGVVTKVEHRATLKRFACKSIPKVPTPGMDADKQATHIENIKREIYVLSQLGSCLNVAALVEVFEDSTHVHIVQELCMGGELQHGVTPSIHYSERTVASYMRAVLKTIAQCHVHNILHRDIKPGNFMLATKDPDARIKAIDFGLAVPFNEGDDLSDLTMEGTPWFLAPETLSSRWSTKADIWAAGVMAHQLLTGRLPFNDKRNPLNPALSAVLRSVLTDKLTFDKAYWQDISQEGKDFVKLLLTRDPDARPTAQEALAHPWLKGDVSDRSKGTKLSYQVMQRVQRFGRNNLVKRSLLNWMVEELMDEETGKGETGKGLVDDKGRPVMDSPNAHAIAAVLKGLNVQGKKEVTREDLARGLRKMGYRLTDEELQTMMQALGGTQNSLSRSTVITSQIDWRYLQQFQRDRWLAIARRAFDNIDVDADGKVTADDICRALGDHIPADDLNELYSETVGIGNGIPAQRAVPGGGGGQAGRPMSFRSFVSLLRQASGDSLDLYDDRLEGTIDTNPTGTGTHNHSGSKGSLVGRLGTSPPEGRSLSGSDHGKDPSTHKHEKDRSQPGSRSTHRSGRVARLRDDLVTVFEAEKGT